MCFFPLLLLLPSFGFLHGCRIVGKRRSSFRGAGGEVNRAAILVLKGVEMIQDNSPIAVQEYHKLILWVIPQLDKFPKNRRFMLGDKIEQGMLSVLTLLIEASYSQCGKSKTLSQ